MPSFDVVNYSLRPNKSIQRSIVFEGLRQLGGVLDHQHLLYIGFGSIWFTDFQIAHKELRIDDMISIEANDIGFARARFNRPYKTVRLEHGYSKDVLPQLLQRPKLSNRPWLVWLDYDGALSETVVDDLQLLVESAPPNSVLLTTFNAGGHRNYGKPKDRPERLRTLLGDVVPDALSREECDDEALPSTLAKLTLDYMKSVAITAARPGGFAPAFSLNYRDGASMTTVGGILPSRDAAPAANHLLSQPKWPGRVAEPIVTPPLTMKEVAVLQAALPRSKKLTRKSIQRLGFDLDESQISSFERYYLYYPNYAQITT